jgi:hypothetical protein
MKSFAAALVLLMGACTASAPAMAAGTPIPAIAAQVMLACPNGTGLRIGLTSQKQGVEVVAHTLAHLAALAAGMITPEEYLEFARKTDPKGAAEAEKALKMCFSNDKAA